LDDRGEGAHAEQPAPKNTILSTGNNSPAISRPRDLANDLQPKHRAAPLDQQHCEAAQPRRQDSSTGKHLIDVRQHNGSRIQTRDVEYPQRLVVASRR
jgi:hypothetical protein